MSVREGGRRADGALEIRVQAGGPGLHLNNRPVAPAFLDIRESIAEVAPWSAAGLHLYRIRGVDLGWLGPKTFDYTPLEARIAALGNADPDFRFLIDVCVEPPAWWLGSHPGERAGWGAGEGPAVAVVSWASQRWRGEAGNALARLVAALLAGSHGDRCVGFQLSSGVEGEWRHPFPEMLPDTGACMVEQFRAFALDKYRRNEGLLRKAWGEARADFRNIDCPRAFERARGRFGIFRDPVRSRRVLDHLECFFAQQTAAALHFCKIIKSARETLLAGLSWPAGFQPTAYSSDGNPYIAPIVESELVDFIANAGPEMGPDLLRGPFTGISAHGKLYLHAPHRSRSPIEATALARSCGCGVAVQSVGSTEAAARMRSLGESGFASAAAAKLGRSQVAVVLDPSQNLYFSEGQSLDWLHRALIPDTAASLREVGAPVDYYAVSDLFLADIPGYKVWVFPNLMYLSEAERRRLDARVKRGEQHALFFWAPGLVGEEGVDSDLGMRCCGQRLRAEEESSSLRMRIAASEDSLTWGHHVGTTFGAGDALSPTVTIPDKASHRLGANAANKTVFASRTHTDWTSVVYGFAPVPIPLLRNALKDAGCHLWTDYGFASYVIGDVLAVFHRSNARATVSLPGAHDVLDLKSGVSAGDGVSNLLVPAIAGPSFYRLRPRPKPRPEEIEESSPTANRGKGPRIRATPQPPKGGARRA